jgi:hypothetical protein
MYNAIIDTLKDEINDKKEGQKFNTLYGKSAQKLGQVSLIDPHKYTLSKTPFSQHLEQMVKDNIVKKEEQQESNLKIKAVNYSLTDSAKIKDRLKILRMDEKQALLMKIYERIFFYESFHKQDRIMSSEHELDTFLSKFKLKSKDVAWARTVTEKNMAVNDLIYGNRVSSLPSESERQEFAHKYWKERKEKESTVLEEIEFCTYLKISNHAPPITNPNYFERKLLITKTDYWQINRHSESIKYDTDYRYTLEGLTIEEFLENKSVGSEFKPRDVEEAFSLLKENGLIKLKVVLPDEIRYVIAEEDLAGFLNSLAFLHEEELDRLSLKWMAVQGPTAEEEEIIKSLYGKEEGARVFRFAEIMSRHEDRKKIKEYKNAKEYNEYLKEKYCRTTFDRSIYDGLLEEYEKGRKKIPTTKEQLKNDVLKYSKYFKEELKKEVDRLIEDVIQLHLEEKRYDCRDIIKKYDFLHDIMKRVCIKMFDPPNKELQSKVIEYKRHVMRLG